MNLTGDSKNAKLWVITAAILIIANCLAMIPTMAYIPLIPDIQETIGMNFSQLGLFSGMAGILAIVCAIPAGMAIKRFGARKVLLSGAVFIIAGLLIISFSKNFTWALSGRGVWQGGVRFLNTAILAALVVSVPEKYRSTTLGLNIAVAMGGTIIAQEIAARISQTSGWQTGIQFFAVLVSASWIILFAFYRGDVASEGENLKDDKTVAMSEEPKPRSVYAMPSVWLVCLLIIFIAEEGLVDNFAVVQMKELWGTSKMQFARILSIGLSIAVFVNIVAGWFGDKYGRWNVLIAVGILNSMVGACLLIGQFDNKSIYITGILIAKALQLTTLVIVNSMAPTFLGGRDVGPIIGIFAFGGGFGQYFGPQMLGILKDVTKTYTAGWVFTIACGIMSTLFAVGFKIYFDRKQKATGTDLKESN